MREYKGKSIIALPSEYVVIDTETTGLDFDFCNIIEISAVRYVNGSRVDSFTSLVKPPLQRTYYPFRNDGAGEWSIRYVDDFITDLTGITNDMLENAPAPIDVLPVFMDFIGDSILIGHNVHFDINFIYDAVLDVTGRTLSNDFIDTLRIARKVFPNLAHHRLSDIASACGVTQSDAHRAEDDCHTTGSCYEIMRKQILSEQTESEFQNRFKKRSNYCQSLSNITATTDDIDDSNPLYGKVVVFTGALSTLPRKDAFQMVANLGGTPQDSITKKTNYLVIGNSDFAKCVKDGKTSKMKKAESYQAKGEDILIISENAFFDMIQDYI